MLAFALVVVSNVFCLACGSSSGTPGGGGGATGTTSTGGLHGCTNIQGSCTSNGGLSCEEWAGYDAASVANFMSGCNHPNQVLSAGPCDTTATVGGCGVATGAVCGVIWSFAPVTASEVQTDCNGQYQTFVTP
ncbi:MAG TPA: hypothetical protein VGP07_27125 [Polyangia bacterium]